MLKYKDLINKCFGQRPSAISSAARILQRYHTSQLPVYTCTNPNPVSFSTRLLNCASCLFPSTKSVYQKWLLSSCFPQSIATIKCCVIFYLFIQGNLTTLEGVVGIPASTPLGLLAIHGRLFLFPELSLLSS